MWDKISSFLKSLSPFWPLDPKAFYSTCVVASFHCCTTDEDVSREKPQNQYVLCGENEEKMILFLTSSNQVEKCCKGQPNKHFFFFYIPLKNGITLLTSLWNFMADTSKMCLCCGGKSHCALIENRASSTFSDLSNSLQDVLLCRPCAPQKYSIWTFLTINEHRVDSETSGLQSVRNLIKHNNGAIYYEAACARVPDVCVLGTNQCLFGKVMHFTGLEVHSFYTSCSVYSSQRALLSLWKKSCVVSSLVLEELWQVWKKKNRHLGLFWALAWSLHFFLGLCSWKDAGRGSLMNDTAKLHYGNCRIQGFGGFGWYFQPEVWVVGHLVLVKCMNTFDINLNQIR